MGVGGAVAGVAERGGEGFNGGLYGGAGFLFVVGEGVDEGEDLGNIWGKVMLVSKEEEGTLRRRENDHYTFHRSVAENDSGSHGVFVVME